MARFRVANVCGARGRSMLGNEKDGLSSTLNGWDSGVEVNARVNKAHDVDVFKIYATGGSNGGESDGYIGEVVEGVFSPSESVIRRVLEIHGGSAFD